MIQIQDQPVHPQKKLLAAMDVVQLPMLFKDLRHVLFIDVAHIAEVRWQRDLFLHSLSHQPRPDALEPSTAAELVLSFLGFLIDNDARSTIIQSLVWTFEQEFLKGTDAHSAICALPVTSSVHRELLRTYYGALSKCESTRAPHSALLHLAEQKQASLFAVFGGQSTNNPKCVSSLSMLFSTYQPLVSELINDIATPLLSELCRLPETDDHYCGRYIDLSSWLQDSASIPDADFISQAPVSMPVAGLLSLSHYCVACKALGMTPGEFRAHFRGTSGHSQGLVIAAAISIADSWDSFYQVARVAIELLFWLGFYSHQARPHSSVPATLVNECLENNEGQPSFMLSVRGLDRLRIENLLVNFNKNLAEQERLHLALENARDNFVVAGPMKPLVHLSSHLRALKAKDGIDQTQIPFSSRKPVIQHQFLPISVPFHTTYLKSAAEMVKLRLACQLLPRDKMMIPVYHSKTAQDLRNGDTPNVLEILVDAVACDECRWPSALKFPGATQILAFDGGVSELVMKLKDGEGVRVIDVTSIGSREKEIGTAVDLYSSTLLASSAPILSWGQQYQPRLSRSHVGEWSIQTKLTQLLGCPPVVVAGMTPTTSHWDFVSAIMNAGYHVELAAGGFYDENAMTSAIKQLAESLPTGRGITCNLIYASPHTMAWQVATLRKLVRRGIAIHGLTIGAGIPSADVVADYINTLGIKHIAFKPGSPAAIKEVVEIAQAHPHFPVILQWTGGRGGGHHSYEDFYAPILKLYGMIRSQSNIILVAGSGFGGADDTYPYLTGRWASHFGHAVMPFDGVLLGSRMMVAQEAHTSSATRKLICQTPGVANSDWERTYKGPAGGIITVRSEMGQPIHKIANRGVMLWSELDRTIFSFPRSERVHKLLQSKDSIIQKLNADFAKPWFGKNSHGQVTDLSAMTYMEVLERMISLMYVSHQSRWIHASYASFVYDFACRAMQRLSLRSSVELSESALVNPQKFLDQLRLVCPSALTTVLNPEDSTFFLHRCRARGQKPVNFIPILDDDFEYYFKKDSLWQSEDVEAVVEQDAGRVCILHGPVAAKYSQKLNEPAKHILDTIAKSHIDMLLSEQYDTSIIIMSDEESVSQSGSLTPDSWTNASPASLPTSMENTPFSCKSPALPQQLQTSIDSVGYFPPSFLAGRCSDSSTLLRALFQSDHIIRNGHYAPSPLRRLLDPRDGTSLSIDREAGKVILEKDGTPFGEVLAELSCYNNNRLVVELRLPSPHHSGVITLPLEFCLQPGASPWAFSESMEDRNLRIKKFYSNLWFNEDLDPNSTAQSTFWGKEMVLTKEMYQDYVSTVTQSDSNGTMMYTNSEVFPIGFGIVVVWDVISRPLVLKDIDGDLLCLVHHSNKFDYCDGASPLHIGDVVCARSQVQAVYIEDTGKYVEVEAEIIRSGQSVMTVRSKFLFKGRYNTFGSTFCQQKEQVMEVKIASRQDEAILLDRDWFHPHESNCSFIGATLLFRIESFVTWKEQNIFKDLAVTGTVIAQQSDTDVREIGIVDFHDLDCVGNPVMDFLTRKATSATRRSELPHGGWSDDRTIQVQIPNSNERYARVSKDYNPIHVSPLFADFAGLPGTITHGMYTSALTASVLEHVTANGNPERLRRYSATFTGMVLPKDKINIQLRHLGMIEGRMRIEISAYKQDTDEVVLEAEAEVEQAKTAYIFTGQGSQAKGMGMDLYDSSPVAKAVWDSADKYLMESYGMFINAPTQS